MVVSAGASRCFCLVRRLLVAGFRALGRGPSLTATRSEPARAGHGLVAAQTASGRSAGWTGAGSMVEPIR
jgi:hypothetical protein